MSQRFRVRPGTTQDILSEAVEGRTPAVLTYRASSGWVMAKSRFLGVGQGEDWLLIELGCGEQVEEAPAEGQSVGVSFRRGSRKCIFNSMLLETVEIRDHGRAITGLRVAWPEEVQELQRRLYHRTPVPMGRLIPVDLWIREAGGEPTQLPQRGKMVDLSAGGMSVELPRDLRPRLRQQDQLSCRFQTDADRQPVEVLTRLTHYDRGNEGHVQLGLQFVGLETCEHGRQVLHKINQMTSRMQRFRKPPGGNMEG